MSEEEVLDPVRERRRVAVLNAAGGVKAIHWDRPEIIDLVLAGEPPERVVELNPDPDVDHDVALADWRHATGRVAPGEGFGPVLPGMSSVRPLRSSAFEPS